MCLFFYSQNLLMNLHCFLFTFASTNMTVKQRIIALSLTHQILSPYTAFVGIEAKREGKQVLSQSLQRPIEISIDDQHIPPQSSSIYQFQPTTIPNFGFEAMGASTSQATRLDSTTIDMEP